MRDLEDLILGTMCINLSEVTGIPTGRIYAKMPDFEYVNKYDGTNHTSANEIKFPCIGMQYVNDVEYHINNYGDNAIIQQNVYFTKVYTPFGEIQIPLSIHLFTNSRKEQINIGNIIMQELSSKLYYYTIGDELPDQYFSIQYYDFEDLKKNRPYERVFTLKLCGQIFTESTGYIVEAVITNINTVLGNQYIQTPPSQITNTLTGQPLSDSHVFMATAAIQGDELLITENEDALLLPVEDNI